MSTITELSNNLTQDLDVANPDQILRIFRQTDSQIFNGWRDQPGLLDHSTLSAAERLSDAATECLLHSQNSLIIIAGAGTSGRLAYLCAHEFNRVLVSIGLPQCFRYLIAGGDAALVRPVEGAEDDPVKGVEEIEALCASAPVRPQRILYVGITCGMSAPYVAGQLDFMMNLYGSDASAASSRGPADMPPEGYACLMGFNPVELARKVHIEGWRGSFSDVALRLEQQQTAHPDRFIILNPVVGPEPVTGSTRMKSGTTTKILLDTCFAAAMQTLPHMRVLTAFPALGAACSGPAPAPATAQAPVGPTLIPWHSLATDTASPPGSPDSAALASGGSPPSGGSPTSGSSLLHPALLDLSPLPPPASGPFRAPDHHLDVAGAAPAGTVSAPLERLSIQDMFLAFERTVRAVYLLPAGSATHPLASPISHCGQALARGGHLYYLGTGVQGIVGLVDASECPPTFGASVDDVRGFVEGGWAALATQGQGEGLPVEDPREGRLFRVGWDEFERVFLPKLTPNDVVVAAGVVPQGPAAGHDHRPDSMLTDRQLLLLHDSAPATRILLAIHSFPSAGPLPAALTQSADICVPLVLPCGPSLVRGVTSFADLAAKLSFNAISTGAHILAGKVYQNYMIDVQISNNKLFHRATNIIRTVLGLGSRPCTVDEARDLLLCALYRQELAVLPAEVRSTDYPVRAHVARAAAGVTRVVPLAVLLGHRVPMQEALAQLQHERIVRKLVLSAAARGKSSAK
ncbi:putative glucokinase regulatory protein [Paratrimastix pyriformis]|uniref:Glucokinase regulatory protein n=1 Tax=Paratrimastix pyriformis TaxID=342808 RepID=A0ABQ8UCW1_9EUKA|nr:putative glucokinase regulatory protein [Paratrimastix pyriformis]